MSPELPPKTIIYVDGFNLYHGRLAHTAYKWLDLKRLFSFMFIQNEIVAIKYFSAQIEPDLLDPDKRKRQMTYWAALRTTPGLSIIEGRFRTRNRTAFLADTRFPDKGVILLDAHRKPTRVDIVRVEEKGSDVNLAVHLVADAYENRYETAIVISNDSDLVGAVLIAKSRGKKVGIANPHPADRRSKQLEAIADFYREEIRASYLVKSLFPPRVKTNSGTWINKPAGW